MRLGACFIFLLLILNLKNCKVSWLVQETHGWHEIVGNACSLFRASENVRLHHFGLHEAFSATGSFKQTPQLRKWRCEAESVDTNETVAAGEQKVSQVKDSLTEKQGPPVLTILAGLVGAVLVIWGLWSLISAILGFFFH